MSLVAITARLAANAAAIDAAKARLWANYPDTAPADSYGMTHRDMREMYAEEDHYMAEQRRKALIALWARPVVDEISTRRRSDGVICYKASRGEDWTLWRALCASYGLIFARYDRDGLAGHDMAYWDSGPVYGGYTVDVLRLYPGCRIEHFNDGETNL
jgi:hypothetical protein